MVHAHPAPVAPHGLHHHEALSLQLLVVDEDSPNGQLVHSGASNVCLVGDVRPRGQLLPPGGSIGELPELAAPRIWAL
eukprot:15461547-Alexandrium_andersonii.AAC.1